MLYHLGYLTIDPQLSRKLGGTSFVIPNKVYEKLFLDYCRQSMGYSQDVKMDLSSLYDESAQIDRLLEIVTGQIEKKIKPQALGKFTEMSLQLIFDSVINNARMSYLDAYTEFYTGKGFADIFVKNKYPGGHCFLLELKYLHKKDDSKSAIEAKLKEAKEEIARYIQGTVLQDAVGDRVLDCYALVFVGSECQVCHKV